MYSNKNNKICSNNNHSRVNQFNNSKVSLFNNKLKIKIKLSRIIKTLWIFIRQLHQGLHHNNKIIINNKICSHSSHNKHNSSKLNQFNKIRLQFNNKHKIIINNKMCSNNFNNNQQHNNKINQFNN